jgi:hypothetical protein
MPNNEIPRVNAETLKGVSFWSKEITKAGLDETLQYHDLVTGKKAPEGYGEQPVAEDVILDGKHCDIWGVKNNPRFTDYHRIYIHIKE